MGQLGFPIAPIENYGASIDYWNEAKSKLQIIGRLTE
jgi:hypothetical protein